MKREFFCCWCGLFHWADQWVVNPETNLSEYNANASKCPNPECISNRRDDVASFAVDTIAFAYFCESPEGKEILLKSWTSPQYSPEGALDIYRHQGIKIVE